MQYQLRSYVVKQGTLDEFTENWRTHILPVRIKHGFVLIGAWSSRETSEFVWVIGHGHPKGFAVADAAYYADLDRASIAWDPKPYLEHVNLRILDAVSLES